MYNHHTYLHFPESVIMDKRKSNKKERNLKYHDISIPLYTKLSRQITLGSYRYSSNSWLKSCNFIPLQTSATSFIRNNCSWQRVILQSQELWSKEQDTACDVQVHWLYLPSGVGKKLHSCFPNLFALPNIGSQGFCGQLGLLVGSMTQN